MVSMRSLAFVLGAIGLVLFLAGIMWALLSRPDPDCLGAKLCERDSYSRLLTNVMFIVGGGLLCEGGAVVLLLVHLSGGKKAPHKQGRGPPPPPPPASPGQPRNRFLEPPVPPLPPAPPGGRGGAR